MILFSTPVILALLIAAAVLHLISSLIKESASRVINLINILIHIAALPLFIFYKLSIEEAVLFYMISVSAYTFFFFIKAKREARALAEAKRYFEKRREEGKL